ncbi:hypothetical protein SISNIDRAFT_492100 [Sistotremastrum niveocremeum HHB9708]|uniref:HTH CENPB-type domain-containing protein n=1 Tax=Sistotremastrum niveocremeum HHB9708 TaxID=1314777 RepID=A0A164M2L7_9AGAM|nr:hypothetical protein SISNIDRAFT_492100 [Sistotremastrum niveocremeum HHB9708]
MASTQSREEQLATSSKTLREEVAADAQILYKAEEDEIEAFILGLSDRGFPILVHQINDYANMILRTRVPPKEFKPVGLKWRQLFMKQHPSLQTRCRRCIDRVRSAAADRASVDQFYDMIQSIVQEHNIPPSVPRSSCCDRWQPAVATGP